ncbi:MAG: acetaldehyde dehydrogenase, partial [Anaerolineaceae bacterium]|nr:acetaldehyde dehydrogenase [Anaerolineaceae bacterium]
TGVVASMTLAPGGLGGAVVSDNITVTHLMNIKRLAYEIRKPPELALTLAPDVEGAAPTGEPASLETAAIEEIVRRVVSEFYNRR